jgi:hypothetical protein
VNVIDDIIRLSETNLKGTIDTSLVRRPSSPYKALLVVGAALVVVFMLLNWQANQSPTPQIFTEWIEPFTAQPVVEAEPAKEEEPAPQAPVPTKPIETASTVTENISPVLTPPVSAPAVAEVAGDCKSLTAEPTPAAPVSINKTGTYVYLLPTKDVQVCVDDGKRVRTVVTLKAGEGKSIHGSSPWVIASTQINALQIYFQGSKVMIPKDAGQRIVLKEQALQN